MNDLKVFEKEITKSHLMIEFPNKVVRKISEVITLLDFMDLDTVRITDDGLYNALHQMGIVKHYMRHTNIIDKKKFNKLRDYLNEQYYE